MFEGERYVVLSFPLGTDRAPPSGLSLAEWQVVTMTMLGLSNAQIARERHVSVRTVVNQLASSYRKLGVRSRSELAVRWEDLLRRS